MQFIIITSNIKRKNIYETICKSNLQNVNYKIILLKEVESILNENIFKSNNVLFISYEIKSSDIKNFIANIVYNLNMTIFTPMFLYLPEYDKINLHHYSMKNNNVLHIILRHYFPDNFVQDKIVLEEIKKINKNEDKKLSITFEDKNYYNYNMMTNIIKEDEKRTTNNYYVVKEYKKVEELIKPRRDNINKRIFY